MALLPRVMVPTCRGSIGWLSPDRTGHAVAAAAPAAELGAADRDHLDPGLPEQRVRVDVPVIGDDHAGLDRHDVVAVVPLLAFRLVAVAAGLDDAELVEPERIAHDLQQRLAFRTDLELPAVVDRVGAVAADLVDDLPEDRDDVAV